jgi:hypothetical protein
MAISRERAVELSHRVVDRLASAPGVNILAARELARNRILQAILDWDREIALIEEQARKRTRERNRRAVEGSSEWDLLYAEELTRGLVDLLGRGE